MFRHLFLCLIIKIMNGSKQRKRNLKTARQTVEKQPSLKKKSSWFKKLLSLIFLPFRLIFRWLNQPVKTHADYNQNAWSSMLTKQRSMVLPYIRQSAAEIKLVSWPSFSSAMRLTSAVFLFAVFFALIVSGLDWALTQIFEEIILNKAENLRNLF